LKLKLPVVAGLPVYEESGGGGYLRSAGRSRSRRRSDARRRRATHRTLFAGCCTVTVPPRMEAAQGIVAATGSKSKSSDSRRRDGLFLCPCSLCSPKPIDPLAPRKSNNSDNSNCVFMEPPTGTLPPPPGVDHVIKHATVGESVKVRVSCSVFHVGFLFVVWQCS
jgi:hypothetical protein